ncbi:MAG: histidine kinase [Flavobacteriaceae bacterium]|nr:MAG: histidine kinase [Flavobacteriaceae bacterium]
MRGLIKIFLALLVVTVNCIEKAECSNKRVDINNTVPLLINNYYQNKDTTLLVKKFRKADSLFISKKFPESIEIATELLYETERAGNQELNSLTNYLIAKIWYQTKAYDKAIKYFKKSLRSFELTSVDSDFLKEKNDNDFLVVENKFKLGIAYHRLLEKNDSIKRYQDSVLYFYSEVINSTSFGKDISKLKSKAYSNLSSIYMHDNVFDKARFYANKSIEIESDFSNNFYGLAGAYGNLAGIYLYESDYEKSKQTTLKALKLLEKVEGEKADRYKADLYFNLAYAMYKLRDYKAYEFQEKSYTIFDKLRDDELRRVVEKANAEKNFDIGKAIGIQQEEIKLLKQKEKTWFISVISGVIIVLLIGGVAYYRFRQSNLSLKLSRNELQQQQKIEKLKSEVQNRILNATIDGKESERKEIAETLHDSVSSLLSSANLHLQASRTQFNGSTPAEIEKSQKIIVEASEKIRDLSHTLVSSVLLKFGLQYSLKDMANKFSNSQIKIETNIYNIRRYNQKFEIRIYNIIQEFINNILKHSKATEAELTLFEEGQKLMLTIEDNGEGFDKEIIQEKDGLGINQIEARVQMMKGKFAIETGIGKGTKIKVELPVQQREAVTHA